MIAAVKTLAMTEWKRLVKYTAVGATIGGCIGGVGGYVIVNELAKQVEAEFEEGILANVPKIIQPISRFVLDRLIAKAKSEGIESCIFQGGLYGTLTGCSLGCSRVAIGLTVRSIKWIISKGRK